MYVEKIADEETLIDSDVGRLGEVSGRIWSDVGL
jgi:hypothetical protein